MARHTRSPRMSRPPPHDGAPYENSYAWFLTLKDGLVVDGTAFFDSSSFNELWRRVAP
jgi:ketosteroid isomerase-like protein